jgi:uncharacterized membrane protein YkoI
MQLRFIVSAIAALALASGIAVSASAGEEASAEKELTLADVPAAVQSPIKQFAGTNSIEKITQESEDNKVIYEAKITASGVKQEIEVAADGTVVRTEKQVSLKDTPSAVQAAIKTLAGGGTVDTIIEENEGGKKGYEVAVTVDGKKKEADIDANGKIERDEGRGEHKGHGHGDKD